MKAVEAVYKCDYFQGVVLKCLGFYIPLNFFYVLYVILHFHGHVEACGRMLPSPSGN